MKTLDNTLRPKCPKCNEYLKLVQLNGYRFTSYYWYCICLIDHEVMIDSEELVQDITEYPEDN